MSDYLYTLYDKQTEEVLFTGVKADCYNFIRRKHLKSKDYDLKSGRPNKRLRTTSPIQSKPTGFFKKVFKKE